MSTQIINQKRLELYQDKYPQLSKLIIENNKSLAHTDRATNALLLKIDEHYSNADLKIMIFGQETNYWYPSENKGEFHLDIKALQKLYEDFYLKNDCYSYGGQFWNGVSRFKQLLEEKLDDKIGIVWNNVIKIGKCGKGTPLASIQEIQFEHFNVIQKEIEILKPDVLLFFSGPNYDVHIHKAFGRLTKKRIDNFSDRQLCELNVSDTAMALRTYHPNFLWRNDINKYMTPIAERIAMMQNTV